MFLGDASGATTALAQAQHCRVLANGVLAAGDLEGAVAGYADVLRWLDSMDPDVREGASVDARLLRAVAWLNRVQAYLALAARCGREHNGVAPATATFGDGDRVDSTSGREDLPSCCPVHELAKGAYEPPRDVRGGGGGRPPPPPPPGSLFDGPKAAAQRRVILLALRDCESLFANSSSHHGALYETSLTPSQRSKLHFRCATAGLTLLAASSLRFSSTGQSSSPFRACIVFHARMAVLHAVSHNRLARRRGAPTVAVPSSSVTSDGGLEAAARVLQEEARVRCFGTDYVAALHGGVDVVTTSCFGWFHRSCHRLLLSCICTCGRDVVRPAAEEGETTTTVTTQESMMVVASRETVTPSLTHGMGLWWAPTTDDASVCLLHDAGTSSCVPGTMLLREPSVIFVSSPRRGDEGPASTAAPYETRFIAAAEAFQSLWSHRSTHDRQPLEDLMSLHHATSAATTTMLSRDQDGGGDDDAPLERFCDVWHHNAIRTITVDFSFLNDRTSFSDDTTALASGAAVYRFFSRVNHSCHPNALQRFSAAARSSSRKRTTAASISLTALAAIPPFTEIVISYCPLFAQDAEDRRRHLRFDCKCGHDVCCCRRSAAGESLSNPPVLRSSLHATGVPEKSSRVTMAGGTSLPPALAGGLASIEARLRDETLWSRMVGATTGDDDTATSPAQRHGLSRVAVVNQVLPELLECLAMTTYLGRDSSVLPPPSLTDVGEGQTLTDLYQDLFGKGIDVLRLALSPANVARVERLTHLRRPLIPTDNQRITHDNRGASLGGDDGDGTKACRFLWPLHWPVITGVKVHLAYLLGRLTRSTRRTHIDASSSPFPTVHLVPTKSSSSQSSSFTIADGAQVDTFQRELLRSAFRDHCVTHNAPQWPCGDVASSASSLSSGDLPEVVSSPYVTFFDRFRQEIVEAEIPGVQNASHLKSFMDAED